MDVQDIAMETRFLGVLKWVSCSSCQYRRQKKLWVSLPPTPPPPVSSLPFLFKVYQSIQSRGRLCEELRMWLAVYRYSYLPRNMLIILHPRELQTDNTLWALNPIKDDNSRHRWQMAHSRAVWTWMNLVSLVSCSPMRLGWSWIVSTILSRTGNAIVI